MMLELGAVLLIDPVLLNNLLSSLALVAGAVGVSLVLAIAMRRLGYFDETSGISYARQLIPYRRAKCVIN